jgi:hypothetical protein
MTVGELRRIIATVPDEKEIGMYGGLLQTICPVNAVVADERDLNYGVDRVVFFRDAWGMGRRPVMPEVAQPMLPEVNNIKGPDFSPLPPRTKQLPSGNGPRSLVARIATKLLSDGKEDK